jgi:anthranilate phosphoribosyltransferase
MAESLQDGLARAAVAIDSGAAQQTLQELVRLSNTSGT